MIRVKGALPQLMRVAMTAALTLTALEVCQSASELSMVLNANELEMAEPALPDVLSAKDKAAAREANLAVFASVKSNLESMRGSRALILIGLLGAATLAFLAALRMRWPNGLSRAASARLLGRSALAAGFFRTLDGAQSLVIARRSADAAIKAVEKLPAVDMPIATLMTLPAVLNVGLTCLVVGLFLVIGHYFRSERVQAMFVALDGPERHDE